jgi:hypothetical protein
MQNLRCIKKTRRIKDFLLHFFHEKLKIKLILILLLKNNSNLNIFQESYCEIIFLFPNFVYLKIGFCRKTLFGTFLHEKNSDKCRDCIFLE